MNNFMLFGKARNFPWSQASSEQQVTERKEKGNKTKGKKPAISGIEPKNGRGEMHNAYEFLDYRLQMIPYGAYTFTDIDNKNKLAKQGENE